MTASYPWSPCFCLWSTAVSSQHSSHTDPVKGKSHHVISCSMCSRLAASLLMQKTVQVLNMTKRPAWAHISSFSSFLLIFCSFFLPFHTWLFLKQVGRCPPRSPSPLHLFFPVPQMVSPHVHIVSTSLSDLYLKFIFQWGLPCAPLPVSASSHPSPMLCNPSLLPQLLLLSSICTVLPDYLVHFLVPLQLNAG